VIDKPGYSGFFGSRLMEFLAAKHVGTLIITGSETDVCVLATVLEGVDRGFRVIVVEDGLCSSSDQGHDALMTLSIVRGSPIRSNCLSSMRCSGFGTTLADPRLTLPRTHAPPGPPRHQRDRSPGNEGGGKSESRMLLHHNGEAHGKCQHSKAAQRSPCRIKRRSLSAATAAVEPGLALAADLMFFNQRGAGAEDRGQRQKQPADGGTEVIADNAGQSRDEPAQDKSHDIFMPAAVLERGE